MINFNFCDGRHRVFIDKNSVYGYYIGFIVGWSSYCSLRNDGIWYYPNDEVFDIPRQIYYKTMEDAENSLRKYIKENSITEMIRDVELVTNYRFDPESIEEIYQTDFRRILNIRTLSSIVCGPWNRVYSNTFNNYS